MRKKSFDRAVKKIHAINDGALGTPIQIKRLLPLAQQTNYNSKLKEWYGPRQWEVITEASGDITAFKESEDWKEIGTLGIHDYKCAINDNLPISFNHKDIGNYLVTRLDNNQNYEIVFYREFIGEVHIGLRPVIHDEH
jgi:hypothetical protein